MNDLDSILEYCREGERVCPVPHRWDELWNMLPERRRVGSGWEPPLPLILSAWWHASNLQKASRLADHVRWAEAHGVLDAVASFLRELPEDQWHHLRD